MDVMDQGLALPNAPTYQNRLRVIGRQLDLYGYQYINLSEVGGGFLVRALNPEDRSPEALEFPDRDVPHLLAAAFDARREPRRLRSTTPLLPGGYEDFLRAVGWRFDERTAAAVTVTELDNFVAIGGMTLGDGSERGALQTFQEVLRGEEIAYLIEQARRRRSDIGRERTA